MPRPITRIVSSSPVTYLQLRTHAPAVASIAESLAGRVRYLYELAAGIPAVEADGVVTPLNPQGRVGVDRSGPKSMVPAMIEALQTGQIGHAALDVFVEEPLPPGNPFIGLENVTLSAHSAFRTPEASETLLRRALDIAVRVAQGGQGPSP